MKWIAPIRVESAEEPATQISWPDGLVAAATVIVMLALGLGAVGLLGPDEPRYAAIARAMAQDGDWITPRLFGEPWFEKPVLYYWAAASSFRAFGVTDYVARLPGAVAAIAATFAMAWAALRTFGLQAAWLTLVMLPTSVGVAVFARAATPDMLFSGSLAVAAAAAAEMLSKSHAGIVARVFFGASLGAAVLAKGPAAIVLAGGAVLLWAIASRQWRASLRFFNVASIVVFCAVAVPWYVIVAARNPEFVRIFLLGHNLERYVTPIFQHQRPVWFFLVVTPALLFPWTLLLVPAVVEVVRTMKLRRRRDSPLLFFGSWAAFPVVFFSFSQSKLPGYVLPAIPPFIVLVAATVARWTQAKSKVGTWWVAATGFAFVFLTGAARYWLRTAPETSEIAGSGITMALMAIAAAGGVLCAWLAFTGGARTALKATVLLTVALSVIAIAGLLPVLDPIISARAAARSVPAEVRVAGDVFALDLDRPWEYGLNYYLGRRLTQWNGAQDRPACVWASERAGADLLQQYPGSSRSMRTPAGLWLIRLP